MIRYRLGMTLVPTPEAVEREIRKILEQYEKGERWELLSDVRHEIDLMCRRLGIDPKTPVRVDLDENNNFIIHFGYFTETN